MATGRDKVERYFTVQFDDADDALQDLSGDLLPGTFGGGGLVFDEVEMTGVNETVKNFLTNFPTSEIIGQFYLNDMADLAYRVLGPMVGEVGDLLLEWGGGGVPAVGDPTWSGDYLLAACPIVVSGGKLVLSARWLPGGTVIPDWGVKS